MNNVEFENDTAKVGELYFLHSTSLLEGKGSCDDDTCDCADPGTGSDSCNCEDN